MRMLSLLFGHMLLLATSTLGEVGLLSGRLGVDGLVSFKCRWQRSEYIGLSDSRFDFYRPSAFFGITSRVCSAVVVRAYGDAANLPSPQVLDLYASIRLPAGLALRIGQFGPPLGFEMMTDRRQLKLSDYSFLARYWKPWDPRDVGVMLIRQWRRFDAAAALVNGNGINRGFEDNNRSKDFCGRLVFRPLADSAFQIAGRGYWGTIDDAGRRFIGVAGEFLVGRRSLLVVSELQHVLNAGQTRNSGYVQASYRLWGVLEPVGRVQLELQAEDRYDFGLAAGVSFLMRDDDLKATLVYEYRRRDSNSIELRELEQKIFLQLQCAL